MAQPRRDRVLGQVVRIGGKRRVRSLLVRDTDWADKTNLPEGTIVELARDGQQADVVRTLAAPGTAIHALYKVMGRAQVDPFFPKDVRQEVEAWVADPKIDDPTLRDLTDLDFVTIDNADSKDLDQALYIDRLGKGFVLYYALADGGFYVRPGTAVFDEALRRGSSFYLPGVVAPMLPRGLSEDIVSLNPNVDRRAMVFRIALDEDGHISEPTEVMQARIRSRAKLTYKGVQRLHDAPGCGPLTERSYTKSLMLMREVGERRIVLAQKRDVIPFNRVNPVLSLSDDGASFVIGMERRNDVERWNEQISLLTNMEGACLLAGDDPQVQAVFRVHPEPEQNALVALSQRLETIAKTLGLDTDVWRWDYNPESEHKTLGRFIDALPDDAQNARLRQAFERQVMMSISPSLFTQERGPHFGIGADLYARFSAPMREIVGIFTHKEAWEKLEGPAAHHDHAADEALREAVIEAGNRSKKIQRRITREAHKLAMDQSFERELEMDYKDRPVHVGTVLGVRPSRLYVQLDNPPMEVKVYHDDIGDQDGTEPEVDKARVVVSRKNGQNISLGDEVRLKVGRYDGKRRRWCLIPQGE